MIDPLCSGILDRFRGPFTGKYTPFGGKAAPCYECSMTLNTKDTKKTGCRKYAVVLLTMIHETFVALYAPYINKV